VGELTDRRGTQGGGTEEYELVTLEKKDDQQTREQLRKLKRDEKRRWLDEQDDMKFSHSIQFNAVPDWSSHYIAYSNLKKMYVLA
jgi:phosphate transporter